MKLEVLRNIEDLKNFKSEMDEILDENHNENPFLTYDWIVRWWRCFGEGRDLFIVMMKEEDRIAGVCPFMITKNKFVREVNFIGYPQAGYMDLIVRKEYKEDVIKLLVEHFKNLKGPYIFHLHGLSESSSNLRLLQKYLEQKKIKYFCQFINRYYIEIPDQNFDDYFKSRSSHHSVKNIRKNENRIRDLGNLSWQKQSGDELDVIFDIHDKRWLKKNDGSGFSTEKARNFFKSLARDGDISSFKTTVFTLKINDRIIGFIYGFECGDKFIFYRLAHDDDFAVYGPGKIMTKNIINDCFDNNFKEFDLMKGYERYKEEWSNREEHMCSILFKTNCLSSTLLYHRYHAAERIRRFLKRKEKAVHFKKVTLGRLKYYFSKNYCQAIKRKIANKKNNEGFAAVIGSLFGKVIKAIYDKEKYGDLQYSFDGIHNAADTELTFRLVDINDLNKLGNLMSSGTDSITRRLYKGDRCYFIENGKAAIGYVWLCSSKATVSGVNYIFSKAKNGACIYELFLCKAYQRIYPWSVLLKQFLTCLYESSVPEIHMIINLRNKSLLSEALSAGFELKDSFTVLKPFYKSKYSIQKINVLQKPSE